MKILVAEDDAASLLVLKHLLRNAGHLTHEVQTGLQAWEEIRSGNYDALLTDWMMPEMDGIELISRIRQQITRPMLIVLITAIGSSDARERALEVGADEFISKPYRPEEVMDALERGFGRLSISRQVAVSPILFPARSAPPIGVGIAASTGGPPAVRAVIKALDLLPDVAVFVVLHGPAWMLQSYSERLAEVTGAKVFLGEEGMPVRSGCIYFAPGGSHMEVSGDVTHLMLNQNPPENYVRPAADPLFRSLARAFRERCIGVVMTGMGQDGTVGSGYIRASGGYVIAQDPATAVLPSMPQSAIMVRVVNEVRPLEDIAHAVATKARLLLQSRAESTDFVSVLRDF